MTHEEIQAELSALRDGELSPVRRGELTRHVASCASCRGEMRDWERLSAAFLRKSIPPAAAETERFVRSVMARLPAVESARPSLWEALSEFGWFMPALGLASAALFISFLPYENRAARDADPVFVAEGQDVALAPSAAVRAPGFGEEVGLADEAR